MKQELVLWQLAMALVVLVVFKGLLIAGVPVYPATIAAAALAFDIVTTATIFITIPSVLFFVVTTNPIITTATIVIAAITAAFATAKKEDVPLMVIVALGLLEFVLVFGGLSWLAR